MHLNIVGGIAVDGDPGTLEPPSDGVWAGRHNDDYKSTFEGMRQPLVPAEFEVPLQAGEPLQSWQSRCQQGEKEKIP